MNRSTRLAHYALRLFLLIGVLTGSAGSVLAGTTVTFGTTLADSYDVSLSGINSSSASSASVSTADDVLTISFTSSGSNKVSIEDAGDLKFQSGTSFTLTGNVSVTSVVVNFYSDKTNHAFTTSSDFSVSPTSFVNSSTTQQTFTNTDGVDATDGLTFTSSSGNTYVTSIVVTYTPNSTDFAFSPSTATIEIGSTYETTLVYGPSDPSTTITYTSGDESVATVSESGVVTGVAVGTTNITASYTEEDSTYTATLAVTVTKKTPSLTFASEAVSITLGDNGYASGDTYTNTLTTVPEGATVTYTCTLEDGSDASSVATVDESGGTVTINGAGTVIVTASFEGDETYSSGSASYTLTIANPSYSVSFGTSGVSTFFTGVDSRGGSNGVTSLTADDITITFSGTSSSRLDYDETNEALRVRSSAYFTVASPYDDVLITKVVVTQDADGTSFRTLKAGTSSSDLSSNNITNSSSAKTSTYTSTSGVSSVVIGTNNNNTYVTKIEVTYISSTVLAGIDYSNVAATSETNAAYKMTFNENTGTIRGGRTSAHFIGLGVAYGADSDTWYTESSDGSYVATTTGTFAATDGVPTAGYFLTLDAHTNGYVTLDCKGADSYTVYHASDKSTETVNSSSSFVVHGGHTYYVYDASSNLNVSSVTFEPSFIYESTDDNGDETFTRFITTDTPQLEGEWPKIGEEYDFPEIGSQADAGYYTAAENADDVSAYVVVASNGDVSLVSGTTSTITVTCTIPTTDEISTTANLSYIIPGVTGNTKVYIASGKPTVGQEVTVSDGDSGETLVTMTYGGWTYNSNKYVDIYETDDDNSLTDSWDEAATDAVAMDASGFRTRTIDGFYMDSSGKCDAKSEVYVNTSDTTHGHFVKGDNSIPCRGAYALFEPAQNGTLSVYILQNGAINRYTDATASTSDVGWPVEEDDITGIVSWRPFYFVDEMGTPLVAETARTNMPISWNKETLTAAVAKIEDSSLKTIDYLGLHYDMAYDTNNKDHDDMPADYKEQITAAIEATGTIGSISNDDGKVKPFQTTDGGYIVLEKSYVKYTFNLTVGKSYYLFSNFSKLGMCGFLFEPGETQPESGSNYDLANKVENTYSAPTDTYYARATFNGRSNFKQDTWTTLCLPFSVSAAQMRKTFGDDVQLIEFKNVTGDTINFIHHVYDQTVAAGVPYIIKPSIDPLKTDKDSVYIDGGIYFPATAVLPDTVKSVNNGGMDGFEWRGQFTNDATLTAGDHYIANGVIYYYTSGTHNSNSFRAYLKQTGTDASGAKVFLTATSMGDTAEGTTTGIMSIETLEAAQDAAATLNAATGVYNLSGQKVSNDSSISSLPAGVYIVNGKKLVIR